MMFFLKKNGVMVLCASIWSMGVMAFEQNPKVDIPEGFPKDVTVYLKNRLTCDYYRYQSLDEDLVQRKAHVTLLKKYCMGSDVKLQKLKKKYVSNEDVSSYLAQFDGKIEFVINE
jgi:hypothetical protein